MHCAVFVYATKCSHPPAVSFVRCTEANGFGTNILTKIGNRKTRLACLRRVLIWNKIGEFAETLETVAVAGKLQMFLYLMADLSHGGPTLKIDLTSRAVLTYLHLVSPVDSAQMALSQLVIGAASRVRYSATVIGLTANDAYATLDEQISEAIRLQHRLPCLLKEMDTLKV